MSKQATPYLNSKTAPKPPEDCNAVKRIPETTPRFETWTEILLRAKFVADPENTITPEKFVGEGKTRLAMTGAEAYKWQNYFFLPNGLW